MTRETMFQQNEYIFRISPTDPRVVERKPNRPYARWYFWLRRDSATEAKIALIQLGRDGQEGTVTP